MGRRLLPDRAYLIRTLPRGGRIKRSIDLMVGSEETAGARRGSRGRPLGRPRDPELPGLQSAGTLVPGKRRQVLSALVDNEKTGVEG
ncbi:hypothetical protein NDU88_002848 [Pleurodeles waltl]|uniref:Uncharacterized protein n=1 Tax=Pleurodeles waltl TaxID=8319 RepID=A0AAV7PAK0_PLEWA|nr:hypothetical protein NDU88_002848 [Pleurodeles waltl]